MRKHTDETVANDLAKALDIDDAVRTIAKSGKCKYHDQGPYWYCRWGGLALWATFGAGTANVSNVSVAESEEGGIWGHLVGKTLYSASKYGRHIEIFRAGPWVNRLLTRADELRQAKSDNFKEVDF